MSRWGLNEFIANGRVVRGDFSPGGRNSCWHSKLQPSREAVIFRESKGDLLHLQSRDEVKYLGRNIAYLWCPTEAVGWVRRLLVYLCA